MKKIRLGMIGCGNRQIGHMYGVEEFPGAEVVCVADPIEERRNAAAARMGCSRLYRDHNELLDNESLETLDALIIAVEPTAHIDLETRVVKMGIPFLVEKPMTLNLDEARQIAKDVEASGLITAVGFQDRYLDLIEIVRDELSKHRPGGLVYGSWVGDIPSVWWWQKKSTSGGQLVEQSIHLVDGLRYLFGEPLSVYATASRGIVKPGETASAEYDTDDHSTVVYRFKNNFTATLVSGCYSRDVRPRNGLYITLDDMVLDYRLRSNLIITTAKETRDIPLRMEPIFSLDHAFFNAVLTGDKSLIRSDYPDALKTLEMAFAANRSMESGQVIYFDEKE